MPFSPSKNPAQATITAYTEMFGPLPEGLLKLTTLLRTSRHLIAALESAVRNGTPIQNWDTFVASR